MLFEFKSTIELPKPKQCTGCTFLKVEGKKAECAVGCTVTRKEGKDGERFMRGEDCILVIASPEVPLTAVKAEANLVDAEELRMRMLKNIANATSAILRNVAAAVSEAEQTKWAFTTSVSVGIMPRPAWDAAIKKLTEELHYEAEYIVDTQGGDFVQVSWLPPVATKHSEIDDQGC